jgi:hypothetical protein
MRKIILMILLAPFLLTARTMAQDKAPTKKQCDADFELIASDAWRAKRTIAQLGDSATEMKSCDDAYTTLNRRYLAAMLSCVAEIMGRQDAFLKRHGFHDAFLQEDADGKR